MFRSSSPFRQLLVPSLVALLAGPVLRHEAQAETVGTPLSPPAGYKPEKKLVRLWKAPASRFSKASSGSSKEKNKK